MEYDNNNRGAIFKNEKKETEKHPDYKGSINVEGVDYWVSSWISTSKAGQAYMSLSVQKKETLADSVDFTGETALPDDPMPF